MTLLLPIGIVFGGSHESQRYQEPHSVRPWTTAAEALALGMPLTCRSASLNNRPTPGV